MDAECIQRAFEFHAVGGREVIAQFNGGQISSDGGGLLLAEVERRFRFVEKFAACFTDHRDAEVLTHPLVDLLKQRIFGLCLGYEDLNDHDTLRSDRLLAVLVGKDDPEGAERLNPRDRGKALAGGAIISLVTGVRSLANLQLAGTRTAMTASPMRVPATDRKSTRLNSSH